ncbi:hypothetical protein ACP70R_012047 [Stipagrostis hirtigluma subsp. patula]
MERMAGPNPGPCQLCNSSPPPDLGWDASAKHVLCAKDDPLACVPAGRLYSDIHTRSHVHQLQARQAPAAHGVLGTIPPDSSWWPGQHHCLRHGGQSALDASPSHPCCAGHRSSLCALQVYHCSETQIMVAAVLLFTVGIVKYGERV